VTLLAGENGSGKSTILEAIAAAIGFAQQGGELDRLGELPAVPGNVVDDVDTALLAPVLSATKPRNGYFLRAESFFNVAEFIDSGDRFAPDLSLYGDVPLHAQPHGESFLALAANRFGADGVPRRSRPVSATDHGRLRSSRWLSNRTTGSRVRRRLRRSGSAGNELRPSGPCRYRLPS
jgi:predicted ATPase